MVRVALAQFSGHESKEINIQKAKDLARQAAGNGARIIGFRRADAYGEILKDTI